ncbi:MAG: hypothetical protein HOP11_15195 [Saprospiraceae bacterium]|nr:hypothetical protein [Saprospiraceae bacterium]
MARFSIVILSLFFSSCLVPRNLTDSAYYNIKESSVRLITKSDKDTIVKTTYESTHNLPGSKCNLFSVTNTLDSSSKLGISIRLWADIVKPEKSTYYGNYPKLGLLDKIHSLKIAIEGDNREFNITSLIRGDSTIKEFFWGKYDSKGLSYSHYSSLNCYLLPFFPDTDSLLTTLNNRAGKLERITNYDFIFWFDKNPISNIDFKPRYLSLTMTLSDSTSKQFRNITDKWKIE